MPLNKNIKIDSVKGNNFEYVIKDLVGITVGRFIIVEQDNTNKKVLLRLKLYKKDNKELFKAILQLLLQNIFKNNKTHKLNLLCETHIFLDEIFNNGFTLEGIFKDNLYQNGSYKDELCFGITCKDYNLYSNIVQIQLKSKNKNIVLKNLTPEYSEEMLNYYIRNKNHLEKFEPFRDQNFYTLNGQKEILIESYKQYINGTSIEFGIFFECKLIGKVKISNIVFGVLKNGILGYSIDSNYEGLGIMSDAVSLILNYAFKEMCLHRIEASTLKLNIKSQKVLLNNDFKEIGLNEKYLFIDGKWQDHITFYKINNYI